MRHCNPHFKEIHCRGEVLYEYVWDLDTVHVSTPEYNFRPENYLNGLWGRDGKVQLIGFARLCDDSTTHRDNSISLT